MFHFEFHFTFVIGLNLFLQVLPPPSKKAFFRFCPRDEFLMFILCTTTQVNVGLPDSNHQLGIERLTVPLRVNQLHRRILKLIL